MVVAFALAGAAAIALLATEGTLGTTIYGIPWPVSLVVAAAQAAALPLALVRPRIAMVSAAGGVIAATILAAPVPTAPWPVSATAIVAFALVVATVGISARWTVPLLGWGVTTAAVCVIGTVRPSAGVSAGARAADLIVFASVTLAAVGVGLLIGSWRDARLLLRRERELSAAEAARRELAEERTRIARELHDIVAHGMSAIQVRAASARYRMPDLPEAAAEEFDELAASARGAMGEMRRLLGVLRDDDLAETAPQPGLADLAALVAGSGHGGPATLDDGGGASSDVDPIVQLTVFRVVQESLSNVARHASGAPVAVVVERSAGTIVVDVRNGPAPGTPAPVVDTGGLGLRGMRERLDLVGGTLAAGATPDGGFAVRATIPEELGQEPPS